jgi:uncharacterized protein (TIGR02246 family)
MRKPRFALALLGCIGCGDAHPTPAAAPLRPVPSSTNDASCVVWDREVSFARAVHDHDARAFAEHVQSGAVFVQGDGALLRGRDAIASDWDKIIRGDGLRLEWHPTSVVQTGAPGVALSRGPYWIEFTKPDAKQRFVTGSFQSLWVLDADGAWRVLVDGGTPAPTPATEDQLQTLKASIPQQCPATR